MVPIYSSQMQPRGAAEGAVGTGLVLCTFEQVSVRNSCTVVSIVHGQAHALHRGFPTGLHACCSLPCPAALSLSQLAYISTRTCTEYA